MHTALIKFPCFGKWQIKYSPLSCCNKDWFDTLLFFIIPCILDCRSLAAPTLHPFHHPSRLVSWRRGLECALACPSPRVLCRLDHRCSHVHPNHLASSHQDPVSVNRCKMSDKSSSAKDANNEHITSKDSITFYCYRY